MYKADLSFHSIYHSKVDLPKLDVLLKSATKNIMKTPKRTPSSSVWDTVQNKGL